MVRCFRILQRYIKIIFYYINKKKMFSDIRRFVELQSKIDCINNYKPLTTDKNQLEKNYYIEQSICLSDIEYN